MIGVILVFFNSLLSLFWYIQKKKMHWKFGLNLTIYLYQMRYTNLRKKAGILSQRNNYNSNNNNNNKWQELE
jgi:hypothetical protein